MSRSYKTPAFKAVVFTKMKKLYNRKLRRNKICIYKGNYYKKVNQSWEICEYRCGKLNKSDIEEFGEKKYKLKIK